jgi:arsenate reductase
LSKDELETLLKKLDMQPSELVRKTEELYLTQYENKNISEQEWLSILVQKPELIQRPILEKGNKAIIARPSDRIFEFL